MRANCAGLNAGELGMEMVGAVCEVRGGIGVGGLLYRGGLSGTGTAACVCVCVIEKQRSCLCGWVWWVCR